MARFILLASRLDETVISIDSTIYSDVFLKTRTYSMRLLW